MHNRELTKLINRKSRLLLEAEMLRHSYERENEDHKLRFKQVVSKAAPLEEKIGDKLAKRGRLFDASINWDSGATCYDSVGMTKEVVRVYKKIVRVAAEHPGVITERVVEEAKKYISEHS